MLKKFRLYFNISLLSFFISGISLLLLPLTDFTDKGFVRILAYVVGAVFWVGIAAGIFFFVKTNLRCRIIEKKSEKESQINIKTARVGALMFFQSKEAAVVDILMFLFGIVLIFITVFKPDAIFTGTVFVVLLYWAVTLHCFLNGKNYKYLVEYKKYLKLKSQRKTDEKADTEVST